MLGADQELPYEDTPELLPEQALLSKGTCDTIMH